MPKKRNSFWTFVFSMLPGAGHMYMGFMKLGVSIMALFFFTIFLSSFLDIGPLVYILPILWFYAFFDCINKQYSKDEDFARLEDHYLFTSDQFAGPDNIFTQKGKLIAGILLLVIGIYILWRNLLHFLCAILPSRFVNTLLNMTSNIPQIIIGVAIIVLGAWLIVGRKKEMDKNDPRP